MTELKLPAPQPAAKPVRRVGTLTMGVALIAAGLLITTAVVAPGVDLTLIARCSPLLLVLLGGEVLWFSAKNKDARIRYDLLSMLVCAAVICSCFLLSALPACIRYYGPDRDVAQQRLRSELDSCCYELFAEDEQVLCTSGLVRLSGLEEDYDRPLAELSDEAYLSVTVELAGSYTGKQPFAETCLRLRDRLAAAGLKLDSVTFRWQAQEPTEGLAARQMTLHVEGPYLWNADLDRLAASVDDLLTVG